MSGFPTVFEDRLETFRTNCIGFASFTVLVWDHIDTFTEEVEYIWKGKKSPISYLFLLNRYLTPLGFMVNLFAYLSPVWTPEMYGIFFLRIICSHFIRYEGSMTMIGIGVVALMMLIRISALYYRQKWIVRGVAVVLIIQVTMNAWLLTRGQAVVHNPQSGVRACTMIFDPKISGIASSSAWMPLLYDTLVLGLTLYRTIPSIRHKHATYVMKRLLEDGLIYFSVIFTITLVLTIMIIAAPPGLKNITAQLELLLTVTMMSRITLNLKKSVKKAYGPGDEKVVNQTTSSEIRFRPGRLSIFATHRPAQPAVSIQMTTITTRTSLSEESVGVLKQSQISPRSLEENPVDFR